MPDLSTAIATAISALGLTLGQAAKWIDPTTSGYKTAHKRLTRYISNPPMSIRLLEEDLKLLGLRLEITIKPEKKGSEAMYHVFHITGFEAEGNAVITAVNTTGCKSKDEAEGLIKRHGWKPGTRWYGSSASSPEAAIVETLLSLGFPQ